MEETPEAELISPRISFSHDLLVVATPPHNAAASLAGRRSDASLHASRSSSRVPAEPEFDFASAIAAGADDDDVAPADRLFAGGKLLPMPPLPPAPAAPRPATPCEPQQACRVKAQQQQQACQQRIRRSGSSSWASPFSRSSSVNSATTTTGAPRSAGRFGCPPFPLMRSWSVGSATAAAAARDGAAAAVTDAAAGHRPHHHHHQYYKKFGGAAAAASNGGGGGGSRAYYYGGSRKGSSGSGSHGGGVRVRPVLNVPLIGTSVSSVLSYLLCDCSSHSRTKKSMEL